MPRSPARRKLDELLKPVHWHRSVLDGYRESGDQAGIERCEQALRSDYRLIREHCCESGLPIPNDVPDETRP
jgi:SNF2 family DNA or RNA helicase